MKFDEYDLMFPRQRLTDEVRYACRYLESRGYRFGTDFGTSSAIRRAADMVLLEFRFEEGYGV